MSILPDWELRLRGPQLISPYDPEAVQPASIDLRLGTKFYFARQSGMAMNIDPSKDNKDIFGPLMTMPVGSPLPLAPYDFALASTMETVTLPADLVGRFDGKSSLGRLGLMTHVTAGFIDPGFVGQITLEIKNVNNFPIWLYPGMKIGQVSFDQMDSSAEMPYGDPANGSHYQAQDGPTLSQSHVRFDLAENA